MADEGWEEVWQIRTVDTDGKPISLFVGKVTREGKRVPALRIDRGPAALIPLDEVVGRLLEAIRETSLKSYVQNQREQG
jgi:hypothetical protein